MAHPKARVHGMAESAMHIACALSIVVIVYLLAGFIADGAVAATRYWSG